MTIVDSRAKLPDPHKLYGKAHTTTINNQVRGRMDNLSPLFARESRCGQGSVEEEKKKSAPMRVCMDQRWASEISFQ